MYEKPYDADMILDFFGEGQGFTNDPGDALTEVVVQPLNVVRLAASFTCGVMVLAGKIKAQAAQKSVQLTAH